MNFEDKGSLFFDKNILQSIVYSATKETQGVAGMADNLANKLTKIVHKDAESGVKIKYTDFGIVIDVYVVVEQNVVVNDIVYKIQQNIKSNIQSMIDIPIKAINVHIMDVAKINANN
ncbi:MAG: Asp23/Gls24 family envelope stress response protein [Clostridia bacterium]|nr:Asp23/Gls24 family envelope stress response protein [Clostridia bacterium]